MEQFDPLIDAIEGGEADERRLAALMSAMFTHPDIAAARARLDTDELNGATIGALYSGYRTIMVGEHRGWSFSLAKVCEVSDYISSPTCRSVAFCLHTDEPIELGIFRDDDPPAPYDVRDDQPLTMTGKRLLRSGEAVCSFDYAQWPAPIGTVDAIFLKAETDTERPTTIAYSRDTLRPVSVGFADHRHTADHFLAGLFAHLVGEGEAIHKAMSPTERQQFGQLLAHRGGKPDVHLVTRWKYIQALGRVDGGAAREALQAVAEESGSRIGLLAKQALAAAA